MDRTTVDTSSEPRDVGDYRVDATAPWTPIPSAVHVPHPSARKDGRGSAFWVTGVVYPSELAGPPPSGISWLCLKDSPARWRDDPLPTRGEYLIRVGGEAVLRPIYAVLRIAEPFVMEIAPGGDPAAVR